MIASGPVWVAGCGNMGSAILRGWIGAGLDPAQVTVIDPAPGDVPDGARVSAAAPGGEGAPKLLLLGIKPQLLAEVAAGLAPLLDSGTLVLSILAGVELSTLHARFPGVKAIVRAMPNLPVTLGKGATVLMTDSGDAEVRDGAAQLMTPLGLTEWITDEQLFHAVTALSGSGPGFVFRFIAALAAAGARLGLPTDLAARLAAATVDGAGALATSSGEAVDALAARVASPGGTTQAGFAALDRDGALDRLILETIGAAARRSAELANAARQDGG